MKITAFCLFAGLVALSGCAGTLEPMAHETTDSELGASSWAVSDSEPTTSQSPVVSDSQPLPFSIRFGRSCKQCDGNIKLGLKCTIPARKTCGTGDSLSLGDGFCVARVTDSKGYCSGRCKSASDCKSGYSCTDLGTGSGKMCLK